MNTESGEKSILFDIIEAAFNLPRKLILIENDKSQKQEFTIIINRH